MSDFWGFTRLCWEKMCRGKICLVTSCTTCLLYTWYEPGIYETVWDHREKPCGLRMKKYVICSGEEKWMKWKYGSVLLNVCDWLPMTIQLHGGGFSFGCNICGFEASSLTMVLLYAPLWVHTLPLSPFPSQYLDSNILDWRWWRGLTARGGVKADSINGT